MADQAKGAQIPKVALSSTFDHWQDMIRVPQRLAREPRKAPFGKKLLPVCTTGSPELPISSAGVGPADRADAAVPTQNLLAEIAGVGAELPFMDTPIRAECESACGDFQTAPAAESAAVWSFR